MKIIIVHLRKFFTKNNEGATLAEYAVLLGLIAAVILAGISLLGTSISNFFNTAAGSI
jgi:Flp pilus assembly pilin Flp